MIDTILFDLDGTLLCMDQDLFIKTYFAKLCQTMAQYGWDPQELGKTIWTCCGAMIQNDGAMTNEKRFWQTFEKLTGKSRDKVEDGFLHFYQNEFQEVSQIASRMEESAAIVTLLREKGYKIALATSPMFPPIATHSRVRWAGMEPEMFEWITTYDNSTYSKPNLDYYREVLERIGSQAEHTMMVGNDTKEDMCTRELGMEIYLITDYLVDRENLGVEPFPHGTLHDFYEYAKALPSLI